MKTRTMVGLLIGTMFAAAAGISALDKGTPQTIATNKDRVLTIAVQGRIAPAQPAHGYAVTWDGKPKLAIGTGGINYNLKLGDRIFGWARADRATAGVAAEGVGDSRSGVDSWLTHASIGNEVRVIGGEARGEKGIVIGKFGNSVLLHFADPVLDRLTVGDLLQVKAAGLGLEIEGFKDVFVHSLAPGLLERIGIRTAGVRLEVPVVKEIPAEIVGQGAGSGAGALFGNWHIQTCYPPDIKQYGLDELRFGDLVLLKDIQTDYGKGYYRGGATVGVVCSGPSDFSGLGIGVTAVLSTRFGKLTAKIDPAANIGKHLGLPLSNKAPAAVEPGPPGPAAVTGRPPAGIRINKDSLIVTAVEGLVQPTGGASYSVSYDGRPTFDLGMASINYRVSLGDSVYGWAEGDHVEPDVTIQGKEYPYPGDCPLALLACIGNEAEVVSGEAKGEKGYYIGRHAGSDDKVWFPKETVEKIALNDKVQVRAKGVGLRIEGFEDVKVSKLSPELLERLGLAVEDGQIVVPVVMEVPGHIMGSGMGFQPVESLDYDIQTTCPEIVERYNLKTLKLGDVVAIRDAHAAYAPGRYAGAVTIGTIIHGFSDMAGHGPGVNPILSAMPGRIKTRIDPNANTAYYLGIRARPR